MTRGRYPWVLVALLWVASFLNAADRSILVATMPQIRDAFGLSATQLALVSSIFFWVYAFAAFVSGRIGDATRRSRVIAYGLVFWSIATGAMSLAAGFGMLLAIRAAVALGESSYYPSATALIGDWHGDRMRSRALSLHQTGLFAGAGIGALAAGMIADRFGWRAPFLVFAGVGIVWAVILIRFLRDPGDLAPKPAIAPADGPLRTILRTPAALILCGVFFLANGASTGVMVWAPTFAHDRLGLDLTGSALLGSATINLAGFLSVPVGGLVADLLRRRFALGRFHTLAIGLGIAGLCLLPLVLAKTASAVAIVLVASSVGKGLFDGCIYAAMHDIVPPPARATAVGLMTTLGFIGAGLSPLLVAQIAGRFGLAAGMTSLALAYFAAVAVIVAMRRPALRAIATVAH
ncbi:MFS transporter [Sphingomonas sp. RP10(2022)]|uniref:MFS transporter n=1 Tax=Sphingomonas liriopis TaxID=2949094 RepID=A0A9X2KPV2_9SPHN|nr:MFS transporter [Sphingomonas liriopis]MCP3734307.1 MFS transporter [Sphingomonas liriopis]